jgi:hypothetical protein
MSEPIKFKDNQAPSLPQFECTMAITAKVYAPNAQSAQQFMAQCVQVAIALLPGEIRVKNEATPVSPIEIVAGFTPKKPN